MAVRSAYYREPVVHREIVHRDDGRQMPESMLLSLAVSPPIAEVGPAFCPAVLGKGASGVDIAYVGRSEGEPIDGEGVRLPASVFMVDIAYDPSDPQYDRRSTEVARRVAWLANDMRSASRMMLDTPFAQQSSQ